VYLGSAFLQFVSNLPFCRINILHTINPPEGFDSNPGSPQILEAHRAPKPAADESRNHRASGEIMLTDFSF
jgi:hypothetical protein